jgi:uncharacterized protein (DUF1015 family)
MNPVNHVKAFKALHYSPARIPDIGACLSQPYDVISPAAQEAYYARDPHNVVRLILGKIEPGDDDRHNRYTRAADSLAAWKRENQLIPSDHPSFYVYEQVFSLPGLGTKKLSGFIGLVKLSAYGEGRVLPHELVLKKPVEDRVALTLATQTQFEYIWGLYRDKASSVDRLLEAGLDDQPLVDHVEQETGVEHRLFRIKDTGLCRRVEEMMRDKQIYIADGHHRYQTMLNVRDELRRAHPEAGPDAPWEYIMMFLVNSEHDGLVILPTHRVLHSLPDKVLSELKSKLPEHFSVREFPFTSRNEKAVRAEWIAALNAAEGSAFGVVLHKDAAYRLIVLKDAAAYRKSITGRATDSWKMLDVNVLNILVLGNMLGITEEMMSLQSNVEYCKDADEAIERIAQGEMQAAFILKGTPLSSVLAVADADEKMPRKSTFFYPKPLSGLVFYEMKA